MKPADRHSTIVDISTTADLPLSHRGHEVRRRRPELGVPQFELATLAEVGIAQIGVIERDGVRGKSAALERLERTLDRLEVEMTG